MTGRSGLPRRGSGARQHGLDIDRPSIARMYDYLLGGGHNFAVDRAAVGRIIAAMPRLPAILRANRIFLRRAVRHMVEHGVEQLLDLGSGIPTVGNVHEIAQRLDPAVRVVYVDVDPVAVAHSRTILDSDERVAVVQADLRKPDRVLGDPGARRLLDLSRPVGVLMCAVLHFLPDEDDPAGIVAQYRERMTGGGFLAVSHASLEGDAQEAAAGRDAFNREPVGSRLWTRSPEEIAGFFKGFDLVEPGLTYVGAWHATEDDGDTGPLTSHLAGVGTLAMSGGSTPPVAGPAASRRGSDRRSSRPA
jgi:hypothetical protein